MPSTNRIFPAIFLDVFQYKHANLQISFFEVCVRGLCFSGLFIRIYTLTVFSSENLTLAYKQYLAEIKPTLTVRMLGNEIDKKIAITYVSVWHKFYNGMAQELKLSPT